MHRQPHDVLGEADLGGVPILDDAARDFDELLDVLVPGEVFQRGEAAASGHDLKVSVLGSATSRCCKRPCALMLEVGCSNAGGGSGLANIGG